MKHYLNDKEQRIWEFLEDYHINQNENQVDMHKWYNEEDGVSFYFGETFGVMLALDEEDKQYEVTILVEDDGSWYVRQSSWFSHAWLSDLTTVLNAADKKAKEKFKNE